jgi:hypothetical protein
MMATASKISGKTREARVDPILEKDKMIEIQLFTTRYLHSTITFCSSSWKVIFSLNIEGQFLLGKVAVGMFKTLWF